ncbi:MAG: hypothetical protein ACREAA_10640 [Candidatus Polarisedimenticolia bacterium]
MKVCTRCGQESDGRDGENLCRDCERMTDVRQRRATRRVRLQRESVLRDLGLTKVGGQLGGTYWE